MAQPTQNLVDLRIDRYVEIRTREGCINDWLTTENSGTKNYVNTNNAVKAVEKYKSGFGDPEEYGFSRDAYGRDSRYVIVEKDNRFFPVVFVVGETNGIMNFQYWLKSGFMVCA